MSARCWPGADGVDAVAQSGDVAVVAAADLHVGRVAPRSLDGRRHVVGDRDQPETVLGVVALWLLATRRWRELTVAVVAAAGTFAAGLLAYGVSPFRAWLAAMGREQWSWAPMNGAAAGWLGRMALAGNGAVGTSTPPWVSVAALALAAAIVIATIARTRRVGVEKSWPLLVTAALLASPLGWIYYMWWILAGTRPMDLLMMSPLLSVPWA